MDKQQFIEIEEIERRRSLLFSRLLELKDPYTKGHSEHVAHIAVKIVENHPDLKKWKEQTLTIYRAGMLHDIGKIAVNDQVLVKPTLLTLAEYIMVKAHVTIGHDLIESVIFDEFIGDAILYHHENFDGSGYPKGLKGEEIPLIARIFRIADYYDALTNHRPYRPAISSRESLRKMKENRHCFDPALFSFFVENIKVLTLGSHERYVDILHEGIKEPVMDKNLFIGMKGEFYERSKSTFRGRHEISRPQVPRHAYGAAGGNCRHESA